MADGLMTIDESAVKNRHVSASAEIAHSKMAQRSAVLISINPTDWRTWDALGTNLPGTPAADDLGIVTGTWGTDAPYIGTGDLKAAGATTRRAAGFMVLPEDYEAAETVMIRAWAGMTTTVADTSATIDFEAWRIDKDGTLGAADLVTTAATSINSLTADDKDFVVTSSGLTPGDVLYVRMSVAVNDAATGTAVIGAVWQVELVADLR